jgi:hypothetical protein
MRIAFLASVIILVGVTAVPQSRQPRVSITAAVKHSKTQLIIRTGPGKQYSLLVSRDSTISGTGRPTEVKIVGDINKKIIIIKDVYPSIPGGMSFCQAGEESFLRVISLAAKPPKETLKLKLESCREGLELDSQGIEWLPQTGTLRIHWLTGSAGNGAPEVREINLTNEGTPR